MEKRGRKNSKNTVTPDGTSMPIRTDGTSVASEECHPLRVLIISSNEADTVALVKELGSGGYDVQHKVIGTEAAMAACLDNATWDVVLSEYSTPEFDALGALRLLQERGLDLPFLVTSGPIGEEATAALIQAGAHDFFLKGHYDRLGAVIERERAEAVHRQEQHRKYKQCEGSQRQLQMALEAARLDIWDWDIPRNKVTWSGHAHEALGETTNTFSGTFEDILRLTHPDDAERLKNTLQSALEGDEKDGYFDFDMRFIRPNGETRWLHSKSQVLRNGNGKPMRMVGICMDITDRKHNEQALQASEERFEKAFRHNPSLMLISTLPDGKILDINDSFAHGLGYARDEVIGRFEDEVGIWADAGTRTEIQCRLREENARETFEINLLRKSGAILPGLCSAITIEVGGRPCLLLSVTDISERKWAEDELRESEKRFRSLATNSPDTILMQDQSLRYTCAINLPRQSFTAEQVLGKTDFELYPKKEAEQLTSLKQEVMRTGKPTRVEQQLTFGSNTRVFDCWYEPQFAPDSSGGGITIYAREITERKKAEAELKQYRDHLEELVAARTAELTAANTRLQGEIDAHREAQHALRKSESQYRQLVETSPDSIIMHKIDGTIVMCNQKAAELAGLTAPQQLQGRSIFDFVVPEDVGHLSKALQQLGTCSTIEDEFVCRKGDGSTLAMEMHASLITGTDGKPSAVIGIIRDISARKRMDLVGRLASRLALNINNVLSPLLLATPILRHKVMDKDGLTVLTSVEASAQRVAGMVRQLIAISQGLSGERTPLQPQQLIRELASIIQETFPSNIGLSTSLGPGLWTIHGDSSQLHQAILGLCLSARDAMSMGGQLTLRAANLSLTPERASTLGTQPGNYVVISVNDTGHAYTPEARQRIIGGLKASDTAQAGLDQSLVTALWVIRQHGGLVCLGDNTLQGTEFNLYLPAEKSETTVAVTLPPEPLPAAASGETILVVDDEAVIRDILREILEENGFKVLLARDGAEALARLAENAHCIRLAIVDLVMPVLDGPATIPAMKKIAADLKIVCVSGVVEDREELEIKRGNVDAFLSKPFTASDILNAVRQLLQPARV